MLQTFLQTAAACVFTIYFSLKLNSSCCLFSSSINLLIFFFKSIHWFHHLAYEMLRNAHHSGLKWMSFSEVLHPNLQGHGQRVDGGWWVYREQDYDSQSPVCGLILDNRGTLVKVQQRLQLPLNVKEHVSCDLKNHCVTFTGIYWQKWYVSISV